MIQVRNIYYMLAYAFDTLMEHGYRDCSEEDFDNAANLLAHILERGLSYQVKKGLGRYYVDQHDSLPTLRGKVDIQGTIRNSINHKHELYCEYEEFSIDTYFNQIIKTTVISALLPSEQVRPETKKALKKLMVHFSDVSLISPKTVNWNLRFNRHNNTYRLILYICHLILDGMLMSTSTGDLKLINYIEEKHMAKLYEKFILNYYKRHWKILKANATIVNWALDDDTDTMFLPEMKTDITLSNGNDRLIIDAKFYESNLQTSHFGKTSLHSGNIYQIFTYVKNMNAQCAGKVSGLLLYAKTEGKFQAHLKSVIDGNPIAAETLDMTQDFKHISAQLDSIARQFLYG